jgi:TolB-like protein/DNA-binding winged helix-turn-helix (wHTH) protein/Tfp pilus assembly protein PilF
MNPKSGRIDAESAPNPGLSTFLDFTLDRRRQLLVRGSESIRLRPQTYDVLAYLVTHAGRVISKRELMESVWRDVAVTDDSLVQCLMEIRRALGEEHDVVRTIRRRGYLFDAAVHVVHEDGSEAEGRDPARPSATLPKTRLRTIPVWVVAMSVAIIAALGVLYWRQADRPLSAEPTKPIRSIAVLPLANLSGNPEQEYFADGMTDELIGQLMRIRALRVISRTSVMRYKGTRKTVEEIARELDVDAVVEGSVIRSAERVRVTTQVIQANPEKNLWAERYELPSGDTVMVLGTLARKISDAIRVEVTQEERKRFGEARPADPETYEAFLKGRYYWSKRTEGTTQKAIDYFTEAIRRDPRFALAFVGLADSYTSLAVGETLQEVMPPKEAFPKAREAATRALAIDDTLAEVHASLAHILFQYDRDWSRAAQQFQRAIQLNPNYANAHHWYALSLMWMGRTDEALIEIRQAKAIDPLSLVINSNLGFILAAAHQYDQGIEQCRRTLEMEPTFAHARYRLGQIYVLKGMYREAIAELKQAIVMSGGSPRAVAELGLAYARLGEPNDARKLLDELRARSKLRYVSPFNIALIYGGLRENRQSLAWLEMAYAEQAPSLNLLTLSPAFDSLRGEPQFIALVRRIGLAPP